MSYCIEFSAHACVDAGNTSLPPAATVVTLEGSLRLLRDTAVPASRSRASRTLFLPSVPLGFSTPELCAFFGPLHTDLTHIRFLRSRAAGRYALLLRFATQAAADRCVRSYSGRAFSSLVEPAALCRLMYVASVRLEWAGEGGAPELLCADAARLCGEEAPLVADASGGGGGGAGLVELPTCPVCLERLDVTVRGHIYITPSHIYTSLTHTCIYAHTCAHAQAHTRSVRM